MIEDGLPPFPDTWSGLSVLQRTTLESAAAGDAAKMTTRTAQRLWWQCLIDSEGVITPHGRALVAWVRSQAES